MKKDFKKKYFYLLLLTLLPTIVFAGSGSDELPLPVAIFMEAFVSIHMSAFVFWPISNMFSKGNSKQIFWTLFIIRVCILLFCDIFISPFIAIFDFLTVFVGAFIIVPICCAITKKDPFTDAGADINNSVTTSETPDTKDLVLKCTKCGQVLQVTDNFCQNCGEPFDGNNVEVSLDPEADLKKIARPLDYDPMYNLSEKDLVENFIKKEMVNCGIDANSSLVPADILKKKTILNIIFDILIFVYVSMIFFHFPLMTYIIGLILLFIFYRLTNKYDLMKYLVKQLQARPQEKISNIVMEAKESMVEDHTKQYLLLGAVACALLPLAVFFNPRIMYENVDGGYAVRFYTFGVTNFVNAKIPAEHNGKPVVSLRGNAFSNMPFLTSVELPDTITEIRGQAFKNDFALTNVNIPSNLEYLGGGSFYNCKNIVSIELPDTLKEMGGETFYGATKLKKVKLSDNLTEIRGNTFEDCVSLEEITIPDKVERIGGHAFYNNTSLATVTIGEDSQLNEIGSSAFRLCSSLKEIYIPNGAVINERAFKESPTKVYRFAQGAEAEILKGYDVTNYQDCYLYNGKTMDINDYEGDIYHTLHIVVTDYKVDYYNEQNNSVTFTVQDNGVKLGTYTLDASRRSFAVKDYLFYMPDLDSNYIRIYKK